MSKKTITFQNPARAPVARPSPAARGAGRAPTEAAVDRWVNRVDTPAETASPAFTQERTTRHHPGAITFTLSTEPDVFDFFKVWVLLPYAALSLWTVAAAQRSLDRFTASHDRFGGSELN